MPHPPNSHSAFHAGRIPDEGFSALRNSFKAIEPATQHQLAR